MKYDTVQFLLKKGGSDTADQYLVLLTSSNNFKEIQLYSSVDYAESRTTAVYFAKFLDTKLEDATTERKIIYSTYKLGESLKERVGRGEERLESYARPQLLKSWIKEDLDSVEITITGPDFKLYHLLIFVAPAVILSIVIPSFLTFFDETSTPRYVQLFFIGLAVVFFGIFPLISLMKIVLFYWI